MRTYNIRLAYDLVCEEAAEQPVLNTPALVVTYMQSAFEQTPEQEAFWVVPLDRKNKSLGRTMVTLGTATSCLAHPREVYRIAVMAAATAVVCVHNHPSGDPVPSAADVQITRQLREAGKILDIALQDHVIIGRPGADPMGRGYYSFREAGII